MRPARIARVPLEPMAVMVTAVRPQRSASRPPPRQPNAPPSPTTAKVAAPAHSRAMPRWAKLAVRKAPIHVCGRPISSDVCRLWPVATHSR